jgi:type I protein arginine methyltransferase
MSEPIEKKKRANSAVESSQSHPEHNVREDLTSKDYYFDSYSHHAIHEEMLKDEVRTSTYQNAIINNCHLFKDKVVLDVGCGTGILSMFAVQAGAKHCYGVDCSSIIDQAKLIVAKNGFSDVITLIKGKIEEIELPVDSVDILISEWMGYCLLYESMLDTVLFARDKWLVKGGIILPDKATLYICGIEDEAVKRDRIDFWSNVYGFDMTPIQEIALREPVVDVVDAKALVTNAVSILHLDILTCSKDDATFEKTFELQATRNDFINGFCAYFECAFTQIHKPIGFSTAPFCRYTHWKQTIFYLQEALVVCEGETIVCTISFRPNFKNRRDLDIRLNFNLNGERCCVTKSIDYRLR